MTASLILTWVFWLVVIVVAQRRGWRWWWTVFGAPMAISALLVGIARLEPDLAIILCIGIHLAAAPRLIWGELVRARERDEEA